jgi:hypothetical protein
MKTEDKARLAEELGASRVVEVDQRRIGGPLDMLALREEFSERLQSSGGRPTDPSWRVSRQVPFKEESWSRLQEIAGEVGVSGRRVGPAQVAALLIENSLEELEVARWRDTLERSRKIPLLSAPDAAEAAGVTYNQFDDWVQRGWLVPAGRRGRQRFFSSDEIVRANWLRSNAMTPVKLDEVIEDIRGSDLSARYLVVTNSQTVRTASSRTQLHRILEVPGSHLVIDQLPERRRLLGLPPFPDDGHDERRFRQAV